MAKQLTELTQHVHNLQEEGVKKQIHLDLTMDGYEMVKRKPKRVEELEQSEPIDPEEDVKKLLASLTDREAKILIHRFGLLGEKKKTLKQVGKEFGLQSGERIRQIESKAIRKLRHPKRMPLVAEITHLELLTAIMGKNELERF